LRRKKEKPDVGTSDCSFFDLIFVLNLRQFKNDVVKLHIFLTMKEITTDTNKVLDFDALTHSSNARLSSPVTIYRGVHPKPVKTILLKDLLREIATDDIEKISYSIAMVDSYKKYLLDSSQGLEDAKKPYEDKKTHLNGFSIGEFSYRKDKKENCLQYVPCAVFDLDGCKSTEEVSLLQQKLKFLPYVFAAFPSPSGHGLRIFVWISSTYETHRNKYMQVLKSLCNELGVTMDKKNGVHFDSTCQNESRFFYYTAIDKKDFYLNLESILFEAPPQNDFFEKKNLNEKVNTNELMAQLDAQLKGNFEGRNDRLFHLAMRFKNNDVSFLDAESYATKFVESDFSMKEILSTLRSAYKIAKIQYTEEQKSRFLGEKEEKMPPNEAIKKEIYPQSKTKKKGTIEFSAEEKGKKMSIEKYRQLRRDKMPSKSMNAQIKNYLTHHYEFRRNIVANTIEYCVRGVANWETLREWDLIDELLDESFKSVDLTLKAFLGSSQVIDYDPFIGYFESLPEWDGVDYIGDLAKYVMAEDKMWWYTMFKKALVRNCACATGFVNYNKQCIVLFGGTNAGKSKFIRFLTPPALKNYFNENPNIASRDDKDARLSIAKNFITNLDDVGNIRETELKEIKSILSKESVNERLIYDRSNTTMARKTTFWGSADKEEFLIDEQGNVRWVIIRIKSILHDEGEQKGYEQNIDMDNVWTQAYHLLKNGFKFTLTKEEIEYSEKNNRENYMKTTMEEELILRYYMPATRGGETSVFLTATDIALRLEEFSKKTTLRGVGIALKKLGYEKTHNTLNGRDTKGYFVIQLIGTI
jgi:predicted P-loop ATPase